MLIIRFQRFGKKHQPTFRIVVKERRSSPQGKYLANLGWYDPRSKQFSLSRERAHYWMQHGAEVSDTCWNLLVRAGVVSGAKRRVRQKKRTEAEVPAP